LNEEAFVKFLKRGGRSESVAKGVVVQVKAFEQYLQEQRGCKELDKASPKDLEAFVSYIEEKRKGAARKYLHGIRYYYDYASNEEMRNLAGKMRQQRIIQTPFPLRDFRGINPVYIKRLADMGIRNVKDMLDAGQTRKAREELSRRAGIPSEAILELTKLSDLARIQGVKGIRARLYYDAGVDTIEKMAKWNPEKLRLMLVAFVEKTGFDGIAPLPKEAECTVAEAKRLPKIIEY
jgi:predicted flap endonuclease-1-like 5' DNA nuclease